MRALIPENGMMTFRKEMDRWMDRFWEADEAPATGIWSPRVDVSETNDAFTVKADVPGIEPKDIQVTIENGVLDIRGEKRQELEQKDERLYRSERSYGSFIRNLRLPTHVDGTKVTARFKNGVLTIVLPKAPEARGQAIPIKVE
jgi:HSP20 family protein